MQLPLGDALCSKSVWQWHKYCVMVHLWIFMMFTLTQKFNTDLLFMILQLQRLCFLRLLFMALLPHVCMAFIYIKQPHKNVDFAWHMENWCLDTATSVDKSGQLGASFDWSHIKYNFPLYCETINRFVEKWSLLWHWSERAPELFTSVRLRQILDVFSVYTFQNHPSSCLNSLKCSGHC